MNDFNVDPNAVINDLLDQIRRLSADNAMLRALVNQLNAERAEKSDLSVSTES